MKLCEMRGFSPRKKLDAVRRLFQRSKIVKYVSDVSRTLSNDKDGMTTDDE